MPSAAVAVLLVIDLLLLFYTLLGTGQRTKRAESAMVLVLFFCSGFPALIYQIVWQRALFAIYGVNVQSVAVVVSAFMLGLGLGSMAGGALSARFPSAGILIFGCSELGIALFGLGSLSIFHWAARYTSGSSLGYTMLFSLLLLLIPTMLMGATLPLLVEHLVRSSRNVGHSVATLYFTNTLGSAVACYVAAMWMLHAFGQAGSVSLAACINTVVGAAAFLYGRTRSRAEDPVSTASVAPSSEVSSPFQTLPLQLAILISALAGFVSLGFEIVWYRVFSLASADRAPAFALLLSTFLAGIAAGSFISERATEGRKPGFIVAAIGTLLLLAGGLSVFVPPLVGWISFRDWPITWSGPAFFLVAGLLGSVLPLLCRLSIAADREAGRRVSLIYLANILGSTAGSLLIGFVLMNYFGMKAISLALAVVVIIAGAAILAVRSEGRKAWAAGLAVLALAAVPASTMLYRGIFERLTFGPKASLKGYFKYIVENRNGVISVTPDDAVMGGGVYDGFFNISPHNDTNLILRAYALSYLHPNPRRVLMIGLASGSWAQVIANHPQVESMEIVEINPGYLPLIEKYPDIRSMLTNPKVHITIDDGRRWLMAHPEARFDAIVMNTSYHWRDHMSDLLSADFLRLAQKHLNAGGILYYNTTNSADVYATGLSVFRYGMRVINFIAVSDSPFDENARRWFDVLKRYQIDGKLVFDPANPRSELTLLAYSKIAAAVHEPSNYIGFETGDALLARIGKRSIITDDNMGSEWDLNIHPNWR
jgi:predicted membrane-bound spermidine synthase